MSVAPKDVSRKPFLRALAGETVERPPFWLMRQAGRYLPEYRAVRASTKGFLDLCFNSELAAEVTLQPIRRYHMDAAILFSDILVVPYGLGQDVAFKEGEGPVLSPIKSVADLGAYEPNRLLERVGAVFGTVARVKRELPADVALIGFAGAPWTVATYMVEGGSSRDFAKTRRWAFEDPEGFDRLIDRLVEATVLYLEEQVKAGAEALQLFDSWAGVLPEEAFRRHVISPTWKIVDALRKSYPDLPIIGFPRGAGLMYETYFRETGVTAIGLDQTVPLGFARDKLQPIGPVQGNMEPLLLRLGGDRMDQAIDAILEHLAAGPFIFNLGHGVMLETSPDHVARLTERLRAWKN